MVNSHHAGGSGICPYSGTSNHARLQSFLLQTPSKTISGPSPKSIPTHICSSIQRREPLPTYVLQYSFMFPTRQVGLDIWRPGLAWAR